MVTQWFQKENSRWSSSSIRKQIFKFQFERRISMGSHKPPGLVFFSSKSRTGRTKTIKKKVQKKGKKRNKQNLDSKLWLIRSWKQKKLAPAWPRSLRTRAHLVYVFSSCFLTLHPCDFFPWCITKRLSIDVIYYFRNNCYWGQT